MRYAIAMLLIISAAVLVWTRGGPTDAQIQAVLDRDPGLLAFAVMAERREYGPWDFDSWWHVSKDSVGIRGTLKDLPTGKTERRLREHLRRFAKANADKPSHVVYREVAARHATEGEP